MEFYKTTLISEGVYRINSPEYVFMDLFIGTEAALLLDTGYGFGDLRGFIKGMTELPLYIVNSHGHLDHCSGNFQFDEDIYIHSRDMELCRYTNSREKRATCIKRGKKMMQHDVRQERDILPEGFDEAAYLEQGAGNLIPIEGGTVFDLGGITLEVVELPGHTKGSIGLYHRENKALYAADAMNHFTYIFLPESADLSTYRKTLSYAATIPFELLYTSHLPIVGDRQTLICYTDCANHLDYERGIPWKTDLHQEEDIRMCLREGYTMADVFKPGFAGIAVDPTHLT